MSKKDEVKKEKAKERERGEIEFVTDEEMDDYFGTGWRDYVKGPVKGEEEEEEAVEITEEGEKDLTKRLEDLKGDVKTHDLTKGSKERTVSDDEATHLEDKRATHVSTSSIHSTKQKVDQGLSDYKSWPRVDNESLLQFSPEMYASLYQRHDDVNEARKVIRHLDNIHQTPNFKRAMVVYMDKMMAHPKWKLLGHSKNNILVEMAKGLLHHLSHSELPF